MDSPYSEDFVVTVRDFETGETWRLTSHPYGYLRVATRVTV